MDSRKSKHSISEGHSSPSLREALKNQLMDEKKYQKWASGYYKTPILKAHYFAHHPKPDLKLWNKMKQYPFWSPSLIPLTQWDNILYIACLEPSENLRNTFDQVVFLITDVKKLESLWLYLKENESKEETEKKFQPDEQEGMEPAPNTIPNEEDLTLIREQKPKSTSENRKGGAEEESTIPLIEMDDQETNPASKKPTKQKPAKEVQTGQALKPENQTQDVDLLSMENAPPAPPKGWKKGAPKKTSETVLRTTKKKSEDDFEILSEAPPSALESLKNMLGGFSRFLFGDFIQDIKKKPQKAAESFVKIEKAAVKRRSASPLIDPPPTPPFSKGGDKNAGVKNRKKQNTSNEKIEERSISFDTYSSPVRKSTLKKSPVKNPVNDKPINVHPSELHHYPPPKKKPTVSKAVIQNDMESFLNSTDVLSIKEKDMDPSPNAPKNVPAASLLKEEMDEKMKAEIEETEKKLFAEQQSKMESETIPKGEDLTLIREQKPKAKSEIEEEKPAPPSIKPEAPKENREEDPTENTAEIREENWDEENPPPAPQLKETFQTTNSSEETTPPRSEEAASPAPQPIKEPGLEESEQKTSSYSLEDALAGISSDFDSYILFTMDKQKFVPYQWSPHLKPKNNKAISIEKPSLFQICHRTKQPYFGFVAPIITNNAFFSNWGFQKLPQHVTLIPFLNYSKDRVLGGFLGILEEKTLSLRLLEIFQKKAKPLAFFFQNPDLLKKTP